MNTRAVEFVAAVGVACFVGCDRAPPPPAEATVASAATATTTRAADDRPRVLFLGDSLTAGLGVDADQAYPALIEKALAGRGAPVTVVNAGVSGDTTAGGLRRLDWLLRQQPDVVVVCLGANDGLRGTDPDESEKNLRAIIERVRAAGAKPLLLGMLIPTNYGPEYREKFAAIFPRVAKELDVPLVPFALEGVGGVPALNQADGIHPTPAGHEVVARNVERQLEALVRSLKP